jgi:diguanylate cyclase (GGDEF)-like protein
MEFDFTASEMSNSSSADNPEIQALHDRWKELRSGDQLPSLRQMAWDSLDCVNDLMLVERQAYGSNIAMTAGFDLTGRTTNSLRSQAGDFFNDTHGHAAGDTILIELVKRLTTHLRVHDILARIGGEEFAVVLPNTRVGEAQSIAERMRPLVNDTAFMANREPLEIACSLGIGEHIRGRRYEDLLNRTDDALYRAKSGGRNRSCLANDCASKPVELGQPSSASGGAKAPADT